MTDTNYLYEYFLNNSKEAEDEIETVAGKEYDENDGEK